MGAHEACCGPKFWIYTAIIALLVLFSGMMSGLTLGLMSLSSMDLEVLSKSGTPQDRKHAAKIMPVVKKQHLLLCTLLICNALAMEALPIFLDSLISALGAVLISVTLILLFGEIIPQSVCSRYGLAVGAAMTPVVRVLVWICFPVAWPISKLLDFLLGEGHVALFRRAELKTLVDLHGNEAGKGGELTHDETTIISGVLGLSEKTAEDAMTPISETFAIDVNEKLDRDLMNLILEKGHSRVPVYYEQPTNIIGLVLVKNLLSLHPTDEVPIKNVTIRRIPRVPANLPLYDILNEFQKGHSHMAVVVRYAEQKERETKKTRKTNNQSIMPTLSEHELNGEDVKIITGPDSSQVAQDKPLPNKRLFQRRKSFPASHTNDEDKGTPKSRRWSRTTSGDILQIVDKPLPKLAEDEEIVGIITMEDVIEEILQVIPTAVNVVRHRQNPPDRSSSTANRKTAGFPASALRVSGISSMPSEQPQQRPRALGRIRQTISPAHKGRPGNPSEASENRRMSVDPKINGSGILEVAG